MTSAVLLIATTIAFLVFCLICACFGSWGADRPRFLFTVAASLLAACLYVLTH